MSGDVSIDVGSVIPYYEEKLKAAFGYDTATRAANDRLVRIQILGAERASSIQCVGMAGPVPIQQLYQPSRLNPAMTIQELMSAKRSAILVAGPGRGKTTLLHWIFVKTFGDETVLPLLFTLRLLSAVGDLVALVNAIKDKTKLKGLRGALLLLIDGYDEIEESERIKVSETLTEFKQQNRGAFLLSCR